MSACPNCFRAQTNWAWAGYSADCGGCNVRGMAVSPKFVREHFYEQVLTKDGVDARDTMKRKVSDEWARIQRLKARTETSED